MLSRVAKKLLDHTMGRLREGDTGPTARLYADDVRFTFPGRSTWAGKIEGKTDLEAWLRRFADVGLQIYPDEVVLKGFPWRQTICARGHVYLDSPEGERVYENRYVIWGRLRWGLLREYEVYEDTQRAKALDEYLARVGKLQAG